jgi:SAM-dependent methyltransferase
MKDNFSKQSAGYSKYRPRYPKELFEFIVALLPARTLAWDAGTGNGQSATELSVYFEKVYATDISMQQLEKAVPKNNIVYAQDAAEKITLQYGCADLITVSQALHWFHFEKFYAEVKRVAAPGGVLAAWCYSLLQIDAVVDPIIQHFHFETLQDHWDKERKYVDECYETIPFPFKKIEGPSFKIEVRWNLKQLEGYINTWSAVQKFISARGYNPVPALIGRIRPHWHTGEIKLICFPIHLKMGYVH